MEIFDCDGSADMARARKRLALFMLSFISVDVYMMMVKYCDVHPQMCRSSSTMALQSWRWQARSA